MPSFNSHKFNLNVSHLLFVLLIINSTRCMEKKQELTEDKKYAKKIVNLLLTQQVQKSPLQFGISIIPSPTLHACFEWEGGSTMIEDDVLPKAPPKNILINPVIPNKQTASQMARFRQDDFNDHNVEYMLTVKDNVLHNDKVDQLIEQLLMRSRVVAHNEGNLRALVGTANNFCNAAPPHRHTSHLAPPAPSAPPIDPDDETTPVTQPTPERCAWLSQMWSTIKTTAATLGICTIGVAAPIANGALNMYATNNVLYHKIRREIHTCPTAVLKQLLQDKFFNMIPVIHRALQDECATRSTQ